MYLQLKIWLKIDKKKKNGIDRVKVHKIKFAWEFQEKVYRKNSLRIKCSK